MLMLVAQYTESGWSVTIINDTTPIALTGPKAGIVVLRSSNHDELERRGGQLLLHITQLAIKEPTLFGHELIIAAVDSFMQLPAPPARITPASVY